MDGIYVIVGSGVNCAVAASAWTRDVASVAGDGGR